MGPNLEFAPGAGTFGFHVVPASVLTAKFVPALNDTVTPKSVPVRVRLLAMGYDADNKSDQLAPPSVDRKNP